MPDPRPFMTTAEVAAALGLSYHAFVLRRKRMVEDMGFPEPMPHAQAPLLWRRDQVEHWIARQGLPRSVPVARPSGPNIYLFEKAQVA